MTGMTGIEVLALAESYVDDDIDQDDFVSWVNECYLEMGSDARVFDDTTLTIADSDTWYALPDDFVAVKEIDDYPESGWYTVRDDKIKCDQTGAYNLHYSRQPVKLKATDMDEDLDDYPVLDVHPRLGPAVACFAASRFRFKDEDRVYDAQRLMGEYEAKKILALRQIDNPEQDGSFLIGVK